jgi:hypothetical protein
MLMPHPDPKIVARDWANSGNRPSMNRWANHRFTTTKSSAIPPYREHAEKYIREKVAIS